MVNKFLKTKEKIVDWLEQYNIKNYNLIPDEKYGFLVDVDDKVHLAYKDLDFIPVKFNIINGDFDCSYNNLTTLEFCPTFVGGVFSCFNNNLTSLEFCPKNIDGSFNCSSNNLTSLKFCPTNIGGNFSCYENQLTSLEHCPITIGGDFNCEYNKIKNYIYFPKKIDGICKLNKTWLSFEKAYNIHLKDKAEYEKQLLNNIIKNTIDNNNSFKI